MEVEHLALVVIAVQQPAFRIALANGVVQLIMMSVEFAVVMENVTQYALEL